MEWLKTRPILSPLTKGILGFVFTLTVPSERGLQRRRFVQNALNGNGDPNNMDRAVKLYRKLKREITFHGDQRNSTQLFCWCTCQLYGTHIQQDGGV